MLGLAAIEVALILPAAALMLGPAPEARGLDSDATGPRPAASVFGLRPATALLMLAAAGFWESRQSLSISSAIISHSYASS
jgi:hypothetical protein